MRLTATRLRLAAISLVLAAACRDATSPQPGVTPPPANQPSRRAVGLMEITITGIRGGSQPVASAHAIAIGGGVSGAPSGQFASRAPTVRTTSCTSCGRALDVITEGDGTIQLEPFSTSTFTTGSRSTGGYRYVSATYRVRNAPLAGGTGYATPRNNLTFIAVSQTSGTLSGTNISQLYRFDGSAANPAIAAQMTPTGLATLSTAGQIVSSGADVLQLFTESEVAGLDTLGGIASALPYGFVVRETPAGSGPRAMAADAAADEFGGLVTFAYRYPLQATASADPFTISGRFLAVDDNETWISQSGEELVGGGAAAFLARRGDLGATPRALFSSVAGYPGSMVCRVRSAGTANAPTAFAANLLTPTGFGVGITAHMLERESKFSVNTNFPFLAPDATNITVNSFQTGRAFVSDPYPGGGTTHVTTPAGNFRAGEEIEVTWVAGGYGRPQNALCPGEETTSRFYVASQLATGEFAGTSFGGLPAQRIVAGDVNGDGHLDLVTVVGGDVKIAAGNGAGGLGPWTTVPTGISGSASAAAGLGDVNGDGHLDIVVAADHHLARGLSDGSGGFTWKQYPYPYSNLSDVQLADWNRDGALDVAVGVGGGDPLVGIFNGDSAGNFTLAQTISGPGSPAAATSIAWGEIDNPDGALDIAASSGEGQTINYAFGNGTQFGGSASFATGSYARVVRTADLSDDGYRDLIVGTDVSLSIYPWDFAGMGSVAPIALGAVADVAVADVDGDHDADIVAIVNSDLRLFINNGGAFSEAPGSPLLTGVVGTGDHIAVGDYNNDGSVDIAVTSGLTSEVFVLLNTNKFDVVEAEATNNTTVVVTFDAPPDATTANVAANYSIPGLSVTAAVTSGNTVTLTTSSQTGFASYTLTVSSSVKRASDARALDGPGTADFNGREIDYTGFVINELYIGNGTTTDKHEFVEVYNGTGHDVDLAAAGLTLYLIAPNGNVTPVPVTLTASVVPTHGYLLLVSNESDAGDAWYAHRDGTFAGGLESNGGAAIAIGSQGDIVAWGAQPAFYETAPAVDIPADESLERNPPGADSDDNSADFHLSTSPTPNGTVDPPES